MPGAPEATAAVRLRPAARTAAAVREELRACLEARQAEIEQAVLMRVHGLADPAEIEDPRYAEGLCRAVSAAVEYGLEAVGGGEEAHTEIPDVLLAQARLAARSEISLDTVLRRYFGGYALLGDFLVEEAERMGLGSEALKGLLRVQAALLDRLLAAVSEEHTREAAGPRPDSAESRRAERVRRLLAGELVDASGFAYEFEASHLGAVALGGGAEEALRELAGALDRRLLLVRCEDNAVWAWLGGRTALDPDELLRRASTSAPRSVSLSLGEPADGFGGWRLTHRQAKAALPIATRGKLPAVRYREVAILATALRDELLASSMRQLYIAPLAREREAPEAARTLRAYFGAGRNVSSAASALGVNRRTVANRIRAVEERTGRTLDECALDFELALHLESLESDSAQV